MRAHSVQPHRINYYPSSFTPLVMVISTTFQRAIIIIIRYVYNVLVYFVRRRMYSTCQFLYHPR